VLQHVDVALKHTPYLRNSAYLHAHVFSKRPELLDILCGKISTIAQFTICERVAAPGGHGSGKDMVLVANTHLFYHPVADFVRLHQLFAVVQCLQHMKQQILKQFSANGKLDKPVELVGGETIFLATSDTAVRSSSDSEEAANVCCMLVGDLNSTPDTAAIELALR
jgi:hypothetical protein